MAGNLERLWSELKRRRVVRLALVYALAGWVVIQVSSTIFPPLGIPTWALSLVVVLVIVGFPVSVMLAWAFDLTPEGVVRTAPAEASSLAGAGATAAAAAAGAIRNADRADPVSGGTAAVDARSIAVLPFVNMSDDRENEYFSDGMTEELLNALVRVKDLQVASRTSSFALKGKELGIREVASKLHVAHILEGSVRKSGERIRITAQLIDAQNDYHLWSDVYDRELKDVFQVQDEIARAIVDALKVRFTADAEQRPSVKTTSLEAYTYYLKGRFHYNKFTEPDLRRGIELYRQALREDPGYARAWAGIADCWTSLADDWLSPNEAYPKAKEAALKALALDGSLSEAHTALGKVLGWYEWNFDAGELALRRAVASNPNYADAHWGLATLLPTNGRLEEAVAEMREALALDPLSADTSRWLARFLLYLGSLDEALRQCQHALSLDPQQAYVYYVMGQTYLARGQPEQALQSFRKGSELGGIAFFDAFIATALAALGRTAEARRMLKGVEGAEDRYVRPEALAVTYAALGETERAFQLLEEAIASRSAGLIYLHVDPSYSPLRNDPRFADIVRRLNLRGGRHETPIASAPAT